MTYELGDGEQVVPEMNEGDANIPDINTYPILNEAMAETMFSVRAHYAVVFL